MKSASFDLLLTPENSGDNRLDKLLVRAAADKALSSIGLSRIGLSRARLQSLIKQGHVCLQGEVIRDPSYKLRQPTEARLHLPPPQASALEARAMDLAIVYEDEDLLVIDKPAGLTTHPGAGNRSHTLVNGLLHHCALSSIGGVLRPGIVHRLDKDTSGLLVVAKNDTAHQDLTRQFAERSIGRCYKALVRGVPQPTSGRIEEPIGRHPKQRQRMLSGARGKHAITDYRVVELFAEGGLSLLECRLKTGRTHQIRAHLAGFGHALVGDKTYGKSGGKALLPTPVGEAVRQFPRQALHAEFLSFIHPRDAQERQFHSDLPTDFAALLKLCRENG